MGKVCWDFPLLGTGNESGNNIAAIAMFKGTGIMDGLAREICQNSLDAKDKDLSDQTPVKVVFELTEINKTEHDMFVGYEQAIDNSIRYWNNNPLGTEKIKSFLASIKTTLQRDRIPILVVSDYNTVGLNGVNAQDTEKSFWNLLVNTEGISIKQDENSAGSFGIGKNAPFAYSELNLIAYNTLAHDGGRAFECVARLVTSLREHNGKQRKTQPIGKYLYLEDEFTGRPILPSDECSIAKLNIFQRREIGTDVAIIGFNRTDYEDWERQISISLLKNFILAIYNGKLEVTVKSDSITYEIKKSKLNELLYDVFAQEEGIKYTKQIYETIHECQPTVVDIAEKGDLSIYVKYSEAYFQSLSRFRSTGMLINTTIDVLPHFSVVVIANDVGSLELSKTLREAEPPQHNEWKPKNISNNPELAKKAKKYITKIRKEIQNVLDSMDNNDTSETLDAGIGDYLPTNGDNNDPETGNDGLKCDVKVQSITNADGRVVYSKDYTHGESATGNFTPSAAVKTGKKKKKRKRKKKIPTVDGVNSNKKGVAPGSNPKLRITVPSIVEHRIFYKTANIYQFYVNSAKDYSNVFVKFYVGRDDGSQDELEIKSYKLADLPKHSGVTKRMGPISIKSGPNTIYVEFNENEIMAVLPEFTMEIKNGDESN